MQISQVSNQNAVYQTNINARAQASKDSSPSQPADTVQLSAAAQAHIAGRDADGDNDGH